MNRWLIYAGTVALLFAPQLLAATATAQTGQLSGKVLNFDSKPLACINVTITNKGAGHAFPTTADSNGVCSRIGLQPGIHAVNFERASSKTYTDEVKIASGESTLDENFQATAATQGTDMAAEKKKAEEAANKSKLEKTHLSNGNNAMHEAQAIRQQIQTATGDERSALLAKMDADYQTAITEYQEALKNTTIADEDAIKDVGLIRMIRNGLITEQKAADMLVQDKKLAVILSNLGMAYSGVGDYQDAIPMLQEATLSKPEPGTYMQLGTDLAEVGKLPEASAACDKIPTVDRTATDMQATCYRNIAVVLTNEGKLADATVPLQKTTQLNPRDALAWKLLGDALSSTITAREENGKLVYVIPPGTIEAYQKYLQLDPNGQYAGQVKAVLDGFAQLPKAASTTVGTRDTP